MSIKTIHKCSYLHYTYKSKYVIYIKLIFLLIYIIYFEIHRDSLYFVYLYICIKKLCIKILVCATYVNKYMYTISMHAHKTVYPCRYMS